MASSVVARGAAQEPSTVNDPYGMLRGGGGSLGDGAWIGPRFGGLDVAKLAQYWAGPETDAAARGAGARPPGFGGAAGPGTRSSERPPGCSSERAPGQFALDEAGVADALRRFASFDINTGSTIIGDDEGWQVRREAPAACPGCGAGFGRALNDSDLVCTGCGLVIEDDDPQAGAPLPTARPIKIQGARAGLYQRDLWSSNSCSAIENQRRGILNDYVVSCDAHRRVGGRAFPRNVCEAAVDIYIQLFAGQVKRSQVKRSLMAACLAMACRQINFMPPDHEIATLMGLQSCSIAQGETLVRERVADAAAAAGGAAPPVTAASIGLDADPRWPLIATIFMQLGASPADAAAGAAADAASPLAGLQRAAFELVRVATSNHIGISCEVRTRVAGAVYAVIRRQPVAAPACQRVSLDEFCSRAAIQKNTVNKFLKELEQYHSRFVPTYQRAGLADSAALP